jgi:hypothetical protein|tara:strand:- start:32218 stop:32772 length:555 start_codon:yes stop_codon:yes gene_type:complete
MKKLTLKQAEKLVRLANHLDEIGMAKEADQLDEIVKEALGGGLCVMLISGLIGCKKTVEEKTWGTDSMKPQLIRFSAVDSEGYELFDHTDFKGQVSFQEHCVHKIEWIPEYTDSVDIYEDGTVEWRYVDGSDPVIRAIGYPLTPGNWDIVLKVKEQERDGEACHLSLTVESAGSEGGSSRTETW